jgi:hypothetical protein
MVVDRPLLAMGLDSPAPWAEVEIGDLPWFTPARTCSGITIRDLAERAGRIGPALRLDRPSVRRARASI